MAGKKPWYEIKAEGAAPQGAGRSVEIYIYGDIGESWDDSSITAAQFVRDLQLVAAENIVLRINSFGGSVPDGLAIYNALKRHPATIDVQGDGMVVSIASLIAMAGDTITLAENALMMIHAPWAIALGNAVDMRTTADMLDKYAQAMATSYAAKTGKSVEEIMPLLTDGADHWYTAADALAAGFADSVGPSISISARFDADRFTRFTPPAAAAAFFNSKEKQMGTPTPAATDPANPNQPTPAAPVAANPTPAAPFARNKEQNKEVMAMFKPHLAKAGIADLEKEILGDPEITVEAAGMRLLAELGKDVAPANPSAAGSRVSVQDGREVFIDGVSAALRVRAGHGLPEDKKNIKANPYRSFKLLDIARASLERIGVDTRGMSQIDLVAAAFTQGTSDFPVLLENTMHKTLQAAYALQADTWSRVCRVGSVSDFRATNRYRVGSLANLDALNENGEFKNRTIPDGEKASITAGTKGNIINLSRQAVINDDLGAFVGLAEMMGRAAKRTIESDFFAMLALNSGAGPTMPDGNPLFHTSHGNLIASGSGGAPGVATFDAGRVAIAMQKDVSGNDYLDLAPSIWLGPKGLGGAARVVNGSEFDPDANNKLQRKNPVFGLLDDIVDTARLTGTAWYLLCDKDACPTFEVAFLDGQQEPYLELQNGFSVDGAQYKVRLDYGLAALDYKGAFRNAGA